MVFTPQFRISTKIAEAISKIERCRGFLDAANLSQSWLSKMQEKAFILEAHSTTHIEGTELDLEQAEKLLKGENIIDENPDDIQELLNYKKAFEFVSQYVKEQNPITEGLVREIHKLLVRDVRGNYATPGEYRKIQNYVVNSITKEIIYTPPSAFEVPLMMKDLIEWLQNIKEIPAILVAGISQFQLVHIHPFLDGNGRCARLLSTLCLYRSDYDFKKLFTISEYYDKNRSDYYAALQSVRKNNLDMTEWLEYFTKALMEQLESVQMQVTQTIKLDNLVKTKNLSDRQLQIMEYFLEKGSIKIQELEQLFAPINRRSLQRDLKFLVTENLLQQEGSGKSTFYVLKSTLK